MPSQLEFVRQISGEEEPRQKKSSRSLPKSSLVFG